MTVYILRHGQTELNKERRLQGHMPTLLNEVGIDQAEQMAAILKEKEIHFDRIFSSPLERAIRTCEIASGVSRDHFVIDERIAEIDFGALEGVKYSDLTGEYENFFAAPDKFVPAEKGETFEEVVTRVTDFFEELKAHAADENILLASHGTAIHAMLVYFKNKKIADFWDEKVNNCDVNIVDLIDGDYVVRDEKYQIPGSQLSGGH